MKRWSLEVTFEEGRAHLGIETQRQWSDLAIERTTPLLFGMRCILIGKFLLLKQPGIASRLLLFGMCLLSSEDICGVMGLFPHHLLNLVWF